MARRGEAFGATTMRGQGERRARGAARRVPPWTAPWAWALAGLLACGPGAALPPRTTTPAASSAPAASSTTVASASAAASATPPAPPPDPLAVPKARGTIVAGPFALAGAPGARSVVFLGEGTAAHAAWLEDETGKWRPIEIPSAVKVREVFVADGRPYAIVESLAALDQPAGLVGAWALHEEGGLGTELLWEIRHEISAKTIGAAALARKGPEPTTLEAERKKLLAAAAKSVDALAKHLAKGGVDVVEQFQGAFVRPTEHVDDKGFAKHPRAKQMHAFVQAFAKDSFCYDLSCQIGSSAILFERDGKGQLRVSAFLELGAAPAPPSKKAVEKKKPKKAKHAPKGPAPVAAPVPKSKPLPVAAREGTSASVAAAMRFVDGKVTGLAEAPLKGAAGTVGLVTVEGDTTPFLVVVDGAWARMSPVWQMSCCGEDPWTYETRFVDGDGRTDLLVRRSHKGDGGKPEVHTLLLRSPRSVNHRDVAVDARHSLALLLAPNVDAALGAVLGWSDPQLTEAEACKIAGALGTVKGLRSASAKDAVVLEFFEPGQPTFLPKISPTDKVDKHLLHKAGCGDLRCEGGACVTDHDGPSSTHLWFRREGKALKLAGVAFYGGT